MKFQAFVAGSAAVVGIAALLVLALPTPCAACSPVQDFEELTLELSSVTVGGTTASTESYAGFEVRVPKSPRFAGAPLLEAKRGSTIVQLIQR